MRYAWAAVFLGILFGPVAIRLFTTERQAFGQEIITISGLLAVSFLVVAAILPSRLRSLTRSFGIESVLDSHRVLGVGAAVVVLGHLAAVLVNDPRQVGLVLPGIGAQAAETIAPASFLAIPPARSVFGLLATAALTALVVLALQRVRGQWERWRVGHLLLAAVVLLGAVVHVWLIGHLFPGPALLALLTGDPAGGALLTAALTLNPLGSTYLALLGLTVLGVAAWRWMIAPVRGQSRYRIERARLIATGVVELTLRPIGQRAQGLTFEAGQFAWLRLARHPFAQEHPFTVTSQFGPRIQFVIRRRGDWTNNLAGIAPGTRVWLDGPHGAFTPSRAMTGLVLIAGGVGITPMLAILRAAARARDGRQYRLILTDRPENRLFREELRALPLQLAIHELGATPPTPAVLNGLLPRRRRRHLDYFLCGSPALMDTATASLDELGIDSRRIHTERFDL